MKYISYHKYETQPGCKHSRPPSGDPPPACCMKTTSMAHCSLFIKVVWRPFEKKGGYRNGDVITVLHFIYVGLFKCYLQYVCNHLALIHSSLIVTRSLFFKHARKHFKEHCVLGGHFLWTPVSADCSTTVHANKNPAHDVLTNHSAITQLL